MQVEDASFLLALGSLTALEELSFAVGQARRDAPGFMLNIAVLAQLKELRVGRTVHQTGCHAGAGAPSVSSGTQHRSL